MCACVCLRAWFVCVFCVCVCVRVCELNGTGVRVNCWQIYGALKIASQSLSYTERMRKRALANASVEHANTNVFVSVCACVCWYARVQKPMSPDADGLWLLHANRVRTSFFSTTVNVAIAVVVVIVVIVDDDVTMLDENAKPVPPEIRMHTTYCTNTHINYIHCSFSRSCVRSMCANYILPYDRLFGDDRRRSSPT